MPALSSSDLQQSLAKTSLFSELDNAELQTLSRRIVTKIFAKNAILITEGEVSNHLYMIASGAVKIYSSDEDGREVLLNLLGPGEYFGELALIDDEPRSASVCTLERTRLLIINRQEFINCLHRHSTIAVSLLRILAQRLRQQTDNTKNLVLMGVYQRVVKLLYELAEHKNDMIIVQGISHKQIAEKVFSSREMISLIMKELKKGDYIEADRKRIVIKQRLPAKW